MANILLKTILIILSLNQIAAKPMMISKLPAHNLEGALLSHFNHVTRYDHSFEGLSEGDCGFLFRIAVQEYNDNLSTRTELAGVNKVLKNADFGQSRCRHTSEAFTWILLVVSDDKSECEVHVPLDLRNYAKDDSETYPLLNEYYALEAVKENDTICKLLNDRNYDVGEITDHEAEHFDSTLFSRPDESELGNESSEVSFDEFNPFEESTDVNALLAQVPSREYTLHLNETPDTTETQPTPFQRRHKRHDAIHIKFETCNKATN